MRRILQAAGVAILALGVTVCGDGPDPTSLMAPEGPSLAVIYDTVPAQWASTSYEISREVLAGDCGPHTSCWGAVTFDSTDVTIQPDLSYGWDAAFFTCPGPGGPAADTILSSDACWECRYGCETPYWACDDEDACILQRGVGNADCRGYVCPAGYDLIPGYDITEVPDCVKEIEVPDPPTVSLWGPDEVQPDEELCLWSASVSGGQSPFTYTWYNDGFWEQSGSSSTYTGGVRGDDTDGRFILKVIVTDDNNESDSDQILVMVDEMADICFH